MAQMRTVAVVGASGNLGFYVVKALLAAGFVVTAVIRATSEAPFPAEVIVKKTDFATVESVAAVLEGHDVVVSTLGTFAISIQRQLIDAAIAARVQRFIPSEFGVDTRTLGSSKLAAIVSSKLEIINYLEEKSGQHDGFTWTALATGSFFEWGLNRGTFGIDLVAKTATIYDSGNEPFSPSTFSFVGQAVAASLVQADKTRNKYLAVASFTITQNELLKAIEEESGSKFVVEHASTLELEKLALEKLSKGNPTGVVDLMKVYLFKDGGAHQLVFEGSGNDILKLPEADLHAVLKHVLNTAEF
ncbi:hypothetical protein Asppvi_005722 [Aspergillus pseudoviridinutans]|uniref:NmrA-like domain-containing protein n=1 Tax=Aspergillus pseudoviridinutans TaxID=1517512 RepID=A0A9P3BFK7_9EURO|nr:uncharacterized protein Asppvi_005722 [Aspergillus pseudoviridinutans]GIJ86826.1 hypothetical protein Asppvi_005722 [Aspergillus pseudoviridinutans]